MHLVGARRGLEIVERVDVPAHAPDDTPRAAGRAASPPSSDLRHQGSFPFGATSRTCGSSVGKHERKSSVIRGSVP